jgi:hypothetical protein
MDRVSERRPPFMDEIDGIEFELYDNTRISDFRRCPRFYFFRHHKHWKRSGVSELALLFGGGWHAAMDVLWHETNQGTARKEVINGAFGAFVHHWVEGGGPKLDEIDMEVAREIEPRTPMNALDKLEFYYDKRHRYIREAEIIEVERPFAVPLDPGNDRLFYIGRIDKILAVGSKRVRGIEHKTTTSMRLNSKKEHKIAPNYLESYSPNSQVDGYEYALHLLYPEHRNDVWVDATLVHKTGEDVQFIPVDRTMPMLDLFLFNTHRWIEIIREETLAVQDVSPGDSHMAAFPQNTNSCFDFNRACPYLDICKARANPLTYDFTPPGFKEEKWSPLAHTGTPNELADLSKSQST